MKTFLQQFLDQLDNLKVDYTYDDDFGNNTCIVVIYSQSKVNMRVSTGFLFDAEGDLIDSSFGLDLQDTDFSIKRKEDTP
ncbi:MAG: hypothetical protein ABJG41_01490 [Cyclobacteriaceae bacterium]